MRKALRTSTEGQALLPDNLLNTVIFYTGLYREIAVLLLPFIVTVIRVDVSYQSCPRQAGDRVRREPPPGTATLSGAARGVPGRAVASVRPPLPTEAHLRLGKAGPGSLRLPRPGCEFYISEATSPQFRTL